MCSSSARGSPCRRRAPPGSPRQPVSPRARATGWRDWRGPPPARSATAVAARPPPARDRLLRAGRPASRARASRGAVRARLGPRPLARDLALRPPRPGARPGRSPRSRRSRGSRGGWRRQWGCGGRLTPRCRATQRRARRGDDPRGLGAHAQHAPAARGQYLEVELVEAGDVERLARHAQCLLDGLACEFLVFAHRRLPRRLVRPRWRAGLMVPAARSLALRLSGSSRRSRAAVCAGCGGLGGGTGKRGWWSRAKPGVQPKIGNSDPQPAIRYCWTIE